MGKSVKVTLAFKAKKERRYICNVCHKTSAETKGTPFYRAYKAHSSMTLVITLLAYGCPVQAIVTAFGWDERTIKRVQAEAGSDCYEN